MYEDDIKKINEWFDKEDEGSSVTELDVWCTCGAHITLQTARGVDR